MPKFSVNWWKFCEELGNLREFPKTSETLQTRFEKLLENFVNSSKVFSRCFYDFLNFSENLRKSSEVFQNLRKIFRTWLEIEYRSWLLRSPQMDPSKLLRTSDDGKVEWNAIRCILPVAYRRICNGNPGLWLAVFFKAWDKRQDNDNTSFICHFCFHLYKNCYISYIHGIK